MKNKRVTAIAEIPEELLPDWRVWVVLHGGKVLAPVDKDEVEQYRKKIQYYEKLLSEQAEQRQSCVDMVVEKLKESSRIYCEEYNQREGSLNLLDAIEIVKGGGRDE